MRLARAACLASSLMLSGAVAAAAPAATPAPIVEKLQAISAAAVKDSAFQKRLLELGFQPIGTSTAEFRAHVDREIEKWVKIIAAGDIKPE